MHSPSPPCLDYQLVVGDWWLGEATLPRRSVRVDLALSGLRGSKPRRCQPARMRKSGWKRQFEKSWNLGHCSDLYKLGCLPCPVTLVNEGLYVIILVMTVTGQGDNPMYKFVLIILVFILCLDVTYLQRDDHQHLQFFVIGKYQALPTYNLEQYHT